MSLHQVLVELRDLEAAGIIARYAIGGAVGATRYVEAASTEDVDVFVPRGARIEGAHLVIGGWPVQFLPAEGPLLEEAIADACEDDVDGVRTRVFAAEHLAAIALQLGRAKDKLRIVQMVEAKVLDMSRFDAILERHDLTAAWKEFSDTLLGGQ